MEKYNTEYIFNRFATVEAQKTLVEVMLGFCGGVLFFGSLVYSFYLFNSVGVEQNVFDNSALIKE